VLHLEESSEEVLQDQLLERNLELCLKMLSVLNKPKISKMLKLERLLEVCLEEQEEPLEMH
jgi:hypothetical protein